VRYANYVSGGIDERSLASKLRLAVVRLNRKLRAQRISDSVTLTQLSAMSALHKCGPLTPGQLAAKEGVQPPSMTRVIAALEALGYVERKPHPTDGRQAIVERVSSESRKPCTRAVPRVKEQLLPVCNLVQMPACFVSWRDPSHSLRNWIR
jgi:DNA-binding MarR family transcriptional regulator